jgi:hypothetical protein
MAELVKNVPAASLNVESAAITQATTARSSFRFGRIRWGLAFIAMGFESIDGFTVIHDASSVPNKPLQRLWPAST